MSDILIIGGGVIGLAIALELRILGAQVTVLNRNFQQAATHAAGGMLAPQAEAIPPGPFLDLCLQSRALYPEWSRKLESLSGLPTEYWACGILSPLYSPEAIVPLPHPAAQWLDRAAIHQHQPGLSPEVMGGWWYPQDAQVDNRALAIALWKAVQELGVDLREGEGVGAIQVDRGQVTGVQTRNTTYWADHYILATGAWSQELLPISVYPKKGQMFAVQVPSQAPLPLGQVLFGAETYIIPRRSGRIVVGATSEQVGFTPGNTPAGVQTLVASSLRLFPRLQHYEIQEFWWGFRPATPDEAPLLGASPYANLTLATGHYRNGILLAPITARLIADWVWLQQSAPLLQPFHYSRFEPGMQV